VCTPRAVAEQIVAAVLDAVLVSFPDLGHSVLDTHVRWDRSMPRT